VPVVLCNFFKNALRAFLKKLHRTTGTRITHVQQA
jgi:hypothetical protein